MLYATHLCDGIGDDRCLVGLSRWRARAGRADSRGAAGDRSDGRVPARRRPAAARRGNRHAAIYAEPTGGAPLWQETQSVAVDTKAAMRCCSARPPPTAFRPRSSPRATRSGSAPLRSRPAKRRPAPAAGQRALRPARRRCRYAGRAAGLRVPARPHRRRRRATPRRPRPATATATDPSSPRRHRRP